MTEKQQKLVTDNLRLATYIAKRFQGHGIEFEDLVAEARLALVRAAQYYNPAAATKFSTYAGCAIGRALKRYVHKNYRQYAVSLESVICNCDSGEDIRLEDVIGMEDPEQAAVEAAALVSTLPDQEKQVAMLVIVRGIRQADAASELKMSQANISRILKRACARLRKNF